MATEIAISKSILTDPVQAAFNASMDIKNQLKSAQTDCVLIFASPSCATKEALNAIHDTLHPKRLLGAASNAVITSDAVFTHGLTLVGVNFSDVSFGIGLIQPNTFSDLRAAGFDWGKRMTTDSKSAHHACVMFSDYTITAPGDFIRGAQEVLGFGFPIIGGVSSTQIFQNQILHNAVVGLLINKGKIHTGFDHGFKPLGKPRRITSTTNNIIHTIDNEPAVNIYKEFLGFQSTLLDHVHKTPLQIPYPLGIYWEERNCYLIKNAVDILLDGSIVCQGEVPADSEIHLMIGNRDTCKNSVINAANQIKKTLEGRQAKLILVLESFARYKILRHNPLMEVHTIKEILGYSTPLVGMYTLGEILPMGAIGSTNNIQIQNQNILMIAIE